MTHVHHTIKIHGVGILVVVVIVFYYDCEVIVIDKIGVHPLDSQGMIYESIIDTSDGISNEFYNDAIEILHEAGIC